MIRSKFVKFITVTDPDSKLPVEMEIRKLSSGGMVGLDGSYLESLEKVWDPYAGDGPVEEIHIPDDEVIPTDNLEE